MERRSFLAAAAWRLGAATTWLATASLATAFLLAVTCVQAAERQAEHLTMVVMDPLAAPLSCPCVEGYAQRRYEELAAYLTTKLGRPVDVLYGESLEKALENAVVKAPEKSGSPRVDLVIGKDSVVRADAKATQRPLQAVARLTGKDGSTTQTGLIVVRATDPAKQVADLQGYRIFFGPVECAEKHSAAMALLREHHVSIPDKIETSAACSDGACKILEFPESERGAAVISSYAAPLLEGCGTIKKGDLRVVGTTREVPFITAFVASDLKAVHREALCQALLESGGNPALCQALESLIGFVALPESESSAKKN